MTELMEHLGTALSGESIGEAGSPETVREHLAKIRTSDVIQTTAKIMMVLESVTTDSAKEVQERLAKELFPSEVRDELLEMLSRATAEGGVDVLFYPQQLISLQKIALAVGEEGPPNSYDEYHLWNHFLVAAAQVTDVSADLSGWPELSSPPTVPQMKAIAIYMLRNTEANRLAFYRAIAGRAYAMWIDRKIEWPDALMTPEQYVKEEFGIELDQFMAICLAPALMRANVNDANPSEAPFDPSVYFRNSSIPAEIVTRVLETMTFPSRLPPEAVEQEATYWNHTDVSARPYYVAADTLLIPGSVTRAFERGTTGIFWMLHEQMRNEGDVQPLTDHFGRIFEDYGMRLVESVVGEGTVVQREISYEWEGNTILSVDGFVSTLGKLAPARVFVEFSTIRPPQPVFEDGDSASFDRYVERIIGKLQQLDRSITHHQAGAFEIEGDLAGTDDAYLPMLVVDEPFFWSPWLRDLISRQVSELALFEVGAVAQPTVCHIGEFENLCALIEDGINLADAVVAYVASEREEPFKAHIHREYGDLREPKIVTDGFDELFERLVKGMGFISESG